MSRIRVVESGRRDLVRLVGPFPMGRPTVVGEPARAHAIGHWDAVSRAVARAPSSGRQTVLAFAAGLGQAVAGCARCGQVGPRDTASPRAWLGWAMGQRPALAGLVQALTGGRIEREPAWLPVRRLPTRPRREPAPD